MSVATSKPTRFIIYRNVRNLIHIDGVVIIVVGVAFLRIWQRIPVIVIVPLPKNQFLVALLDVEVGIPQFVSELFDCPIRLHKLFYRGIPKPDFVIFQHREDFFVCNPVEVTDDNEVLVMLTQTLDIGSCEGERRIRYHDIALIQQVETFLVSEIAVTFQRGLNSDFYVIVISTLVLHLVGGLGAVVVRGNQLLQTKFGEVQVEIPPESRPSRVVTVAEYNLASEMLLVVPQFLRDILDSGVELIILRVLRLMKVIVLCHLRILPKTKPPMP